MLIDRIKYYIKHPEDECGLKDMFTDEERDILHTIQELEEIRYVIISENTRNSSSTAMRTEKICQRRAKEKSINFQLKEQIIKQMDILLAQGKIEAWEEILAWYQLLKAKALVVNVFWEFPVLETMLKAYMVERKLFNDEESKISVLRLHDMKELTETYLKIVFLLRRIEYGVEPADEILYYLAEGKISLAVVEAVLEDAQIFDKGKVRKTIKRWTEPDRGNRITVLLYAYNEMEKVKLSVESFRSFCDTDVSLVIVDDNSRDGLREWAKEQKDLTYILLDEGHMGCGKALNLAREELGIHTDLLIMNGYYALTPKYLSRMQELLYSEENIGAVSSIICNGGGYNPNFLPVIQDYKIAVEMAEAEDGAKGKYVLMPHSNAVLWKKDTLLALGGFEEKVESMRAVIDDYCMRMVMADRKMKVCLNAFLWTLNAGDPMGERYSLKDDYWDVLEKKWGMHYFNDIYNPELIDLIEAEKEEKFSVLEIGCDCGATLLEIKNRYPNAEVYGSEINAAAAAVASHVANVVVNNIENKDLPFPKDKFDYIIFGDVLEHLHNPLETLNYCRGFLREGGGIIASIPNVMHISVVEQLLRGNFTYMETGLLDKTHIHLFTYNEIVRMFRKAGFEICNVKGGGVPISGSQQELIDVLLPLGENVERFMYEVFQYAVYAKVEAADAKESL